MQRVREILRLRAQGQELRPIGLSVGASPSTVHGYLRRAERAQISWSEAQAMSDSALRGALFPSGRGGESTTVERAPFDCGHIHVELRRQGVTLLLLWQEYIVDCEKTAKRPYSYSQFCDRYALYKKGLCRSVRLSHRAGEKVFVDYSGKKARIFERATGEFREVEVFVMTLAASGYSYAEASWSQTVPDFCSSLMRGLDFLGGVPEVLVPDQLRSAVSKPCRYDPEIHRTLADLAAHYQVTVLPARPRKPKDKAKVEGAVLLVQRWVLAKIRNERFESLEELNERIAHLVRELNERPFQKLSGSRRILFEDLDKPALRSLPLSRFELGEWKRARVHPDSHVSYHERYYSVPSKHVSELVELWVTPSVVEVYADGERIASHRRSFAPKGTAVTDEAHLNEAANEARRWPKERMLSWARSHGNNVERAASCILSSYPRPEFGYRAVLGILRLADQYGSQALDEVCERALEHQHVPPRRRFLQALLQKQRSTKAVRRSLGHHEHLRGTEEFDFAETNLASKANKEIH